MPIQIYQLPFLIGLNYSRIILKVEKFFNELGKDNNFVLYLMKILSHVFW